MQPQRGDSLHEQRAQGQLSRAAHPALTRFNSEQQIRSGSSTRGGGGFVGGRGERKSCWLYVSVALPIKGPELSVAVQIP